jgi:hypothetical protein
MIAIEMVEPKPARSSLRFRFVLVALLLLPLALSFTRLPGLPEPPRKSTGMGAFAAALELAIPLYSGSTLAWSLLPAVALWQLALAFLGRRSSDADDVSSRKEHARVVLLVGTVLLTVALAAVQMWSIARHVAGVAPRSAPPVLGLALQAVLLLGLVVVALEVSRRGARSGIVALASGDWLAQDVSRLRARSDFVGDALTGHGAQVLALVLVVLVFAFVLREAPARTPGALSRLGQRAKPLWPLGVAGLVKAVTVTVMLAEAISRDGLEGLLEHGPLDAAVALGLLLGGLALALARSDPSAPPVAPDGMLHPTEIALIPSLAAAVVAAFVAWRAFVAESGAEPYLGGSANEVIRVVAQHGFLVSSLVGFATLGAAFALSRRGASDREAA